MLAATLGSLIAVGLFFTLVLLLVSATASLLVNPSEAGVVKSNSILDLNLNIPITDRNPDLDELAILFELNDQVLGLPEILTALEKATNNPNIKGIRLRADLITTGWSQTRTLREALKKFQNSGKFIYAYAELLTQKGYYLCSVADTLVLNPVGNIEFKGLASEVRYYKDFQEEYGIKMEVVRLGKYKSAVEPFLENRMSEANRKQITSLLNDLWGTLKKEIAESRALVPDSLDQLIIDQKISTPEEALKAQLIDGLGYESDLEDLLTQKLKLTNNKEINTTSLSAVNQSIEDYDTQVKDRIAIVYATGPILYGEGTRSIIAQGVFVETLQDLATDDWVKAVVVRIDSPGGSALTSELLWQALEVVKKEKPVLVSMGNTAASGGYYMAAGADQIYAEPLTITGSIGVFATLPNAHSLLKKNGINSEIVETHPNALGYSIFQPLSPAFEAQLKKGIEHTYSTFKKRVAEGRGLTEAQVELLAQGRVWTGNQALENGLVDALGGLPETIKAAAQAANIEKYNTIAYPQFEKDLSSLVSDLQLNVAMGQLFNFLFPQSVQSKIEQIQQSLPTDYIQTALPYELKIY